VLQIESTLLVVIDIQGNLARAATDRDLFFENTRKLIQGAKIFQLPIMVTEQIPEKLGPTIQDVAELLDGIDRLRKATFSCCGNSAFMEAFEKVNRRQVLLCGIESHICVYQTALDLLGRDYEVHAVADAISSRTAKNRAIGLKKMIAAGAHLTSTETVLFELLRTAESDKFKDIFRVIK
jgi:nicotinamidase-related amidase